MQTMTAKDAKTHFGEYLDAIQREPVIVTKNNRPVAITLSIADAADTLIPEMFMEKEPGYEEWFAEKVNRSLAGLNAGEATLTAHSEVMKRVWEKLQAQEKPPSV